MRVPFLIAAAAITLTACGPKGPSDADIMAGNVPGENQEAPGSPGAPGPTPIGPQGSSSAAIPVPYGGVPAMTPQTGLSVVLTSIGDRKISVIQEVMAVRPDLGLADAKALVESSSPVIRSGVSAAEATDIKARLEAAGATVQIN